MSKNIKWTYDAFYAWYKNYFMYVADETKAQPPVTGILYETKRPKKKDMGVLEPFQQRHLHYGGESPVQDYNVFPNGIHVLYDKAQSLQKWLFFVFPTYVDCESKTLVGDHFTFVLDNQHVGKECHFHSTNYVCNKKYNTWLDPHEKDYFCSNVELPRQGLTDAIIKKKQHQNIKGIILDIMRFPWKDGTSGGTRKHRKTLINESQVRPILSHTFSELWLERGYKQMHAIGCIQSHMTQWSVRIVRKGRNVKVKPAYVFKLLTTASEAEFQETLAGLILQQEPDD